MSMKQFWKAVLLAIVFVAGYEILNAVLKRYIFGTDVINDFWDAFIVVVIVFISITIVNKQSSSPE